MPVVVNKQLVSEPLRINYETAGTIRPQSNDFANNTIACDLHGRKVALRVESQRRTQRQ